MALDFPASPTNGQVYGSYVYNSTVGAWQAREDSATVATISTVFPTSANPGDIWYDSDDGTSYIYYDDGTSAQWVELLSSGLPLLDTKADVTYVDSQDALKANIASPTFTGTVTSPRFISTQATGTAPLTVSSTTAVTNLNADLLDGNHSTAFSPAAGSSSITTVGTITSGTWNGTTLAVANGGTGTTTGTLSDSAYNRVLNPSGAVFTTGTNVFTGAIRIILPVGWTSHMHKFNVSVYDYNNLKSFDVSIAGYNFTGGSWFNPTAYILGNQDVSVNYTVRFGYTAGGRACIYIGETNSTWNYPQVAVNNVLVGFSSSSSAWLSGWSVDFVTAFENVSQTVTNTQISAGLVPIIPTSVSVNSGSASVAANGTINFSGGVTNLRVNGCFSSAYKYYRVMFEVEATSSGMDLMFQLINLGSGYTYGRIGTYSGPTFTQTFASGSAAAMMSRSNGGNGSGGWMDVINPAHAATKRFLSQSIDSGFLLWLGSINGSLSTFSDFQIYSLQGGTLTNGSLKVYGYR